MKEKIKFFICSSILHTPIGEMAVLADETHLYFLDFTDAPHHQQKLHRLELKLNVKIDKRRTKAMEVLQSELDLYFDHSLHFFETPFALIGTCFQKQVWNELQKIKYGKTVSYSELAKSVSIPKGHRAVARANSMNFLPIIIPCHRVINASGALGGYSCGLWRKSWLLDHERKIKKSEN